VTPDLLAVADLDGDGHKDIITGSRTSATLLVLFGGGKGKFSRTLQLKQPGMATALAAQRIDRGSACWSLLVGVSGVKGAPPCAGGLHRQRQREFVRCSACRSRLLSLRLPSATWQ
jgi:hypothetical protein